MDVAHVVAAQIDVHQAWHEFVWCGVGVLGDALDEGRSAVADADDGDAHGAPVSGLGEAHSASIARGKRFPKAFTEPRSRSPRGPSEPPGSATRRARPRRRRTSRG